MERMNESIREQVLDICKEMFDRLVEMIDNQTDEERCIMPSGRPGSMIIAEFGSDQPNIDRTEDPFEDPFWKKKIQKAWKYSEGVLEQISLVEEPELQYVELSYLDPIYARFTYSAEKSPVCVEVFFAPRYASGFVYPVISVDGKEVLGEQHLTWIS